MKFRIFGIGLLSHGVLCEDLSSPVPLTALRALSARNPKKLDARVESTEATHDLQGSKAKYGGNAYISGPYYGYDKEKKSYKVDREYFPAWYGGGYYPGGYGYNGGYWAGGWPGAGLGGGWNGVGLGGGYLPGVGAAWGAGNIAQGNIAAPFSNPSNWVGAPGSQQVLIPQGTPFRRPIGVNEDAETVLPSVDIDSHNQNQIIGAIRKMITEILTQNDSVTDKVQTSATNSNLIMLPGGAGAFPGIFDLFRNGGAGKNGGILSILAPFTKMLQEIDADPQLILDTLEKYIDESKDVIKSKLVDI